MFVYILLLIAILITFISMIIYTIRKTHTLIKDRINNKKLCWLLSFTPILLFIIGIKIDMINAIIVDLQLFIFILLSELILFIIKKINRINIKPYISIIMGVILTILWLGNGYYMAHHVVETNYVIYTEKNIGVDNFRIAQISDSHIGATMDGDVFAKYMEDISKTNPDIVVITGDYVDDDTTYEDMVKGCKALSNINNKHGVYYIFGNHDKGYYRNRNFSEEELRNELEKNNVIILEDKSIDVTDNIILIGRQDAQVKERLSATDLTKEIEKDKYIIMLDHQPNDYENEVKSESDLVLSGHTHGGQLIPLGPIGLLLKANDRIYGLEKRNNTTFIVNSGLGDWAIKFKTGAKSEYTIIDIKSK